MIQNGILESCYSAMLKDATGNSQECKSTSCSHSKDTNESNHINKKRTPLERACFILTIILTRH